MIWSGPLLPLGALVLPLVLGLVAALPPVRPRAILLLPVAPLPALAVALPGLSGEATVAADLLLGVRLELDRQGALFLGVSALLWTLAGLYATAYLRDTKKPAVFTAFWCLTLCGNLGVFLAGDVVTFYASFTAVSLPAYILIVHEATGPAFRAGRIYMILALIGETSLLSGLLIACAEADMLRIDEIRSALAASPARDVVIALLVTGFGIKAGLVPLHVWLPLAHPEAPTPASAVLSGAIVKAGIFGLIQFLPTSGGIGPWSLALVSTGLFGAWFGVLAGIAQSNAKAVLAYSTVSQMGLVIAAVGAGLVADDPAHVHALVALYVVHHAAAKGALFLSVGVADHAGRRDLPVLLAVTALVALSVSGLPLTGGGVTKTALKGAFHGASKVIVAASAAGTALLLLRFWVLLRRRAADAPRAAELRLSAPFYGAAAVALIAPWLLLSTAGLEASYIVTGQNLWSAAWPLLVAAALAVAALRVRMRAPPIPPGDLAVAFERLGQLRTPRTAGWPSFRPRRIPALPLHRVERALASWGVAGLALLGFAIGSAVLLL